MKERLNKYLASTSHYSRRQADHLIKAGRVTVNGKTATVGLSVDSNDLIQLDGHPVAPRAKQHTYLMLNKPIGIICSTDERAKDNVLTLIKTKQRIFPVGRLDVESSGLLLLTDDGELANQLTHPRYGHEKEYLVKLERDISDRDLATLSAGVKLDDHQTLPADIYRQGLDRFAIIIREGRNRQIRRMCEAIGYRVVSLKRIRVHNLKLGRLRPGEWRELTTQEVLRLKQPNSQHFKLSTKERKKRSSS